MIGKEFILGVNYWPRKKAMYWWKDFDAAEVREEFSVIAEIGMRMVRMFLLWEDFQPRPDEVDKQALDNLETVANIAADLGLELNLTFFVGHMSGPNWAPEWMLERDKPKPANVRQVVSGGVVVDTGYRNQFTDGIVLAAEELLLREVVTRLKGHPGVGLWNLGNEPDLFAWPADAESGRAWVRRMANLIREIDPDTPVTCGLHSRDLMEDNGLHVDKVFPEVDVAVMHGYPMYMPWLKDPLDPDFVPYLCALTSALCGKPALAEEFGGPTLSPGETSTTWDWDTYYGGTKSQFMASEEDFAAYIEAVLPKLVEVGSLGAVLWCYADYDPSLYDRPPCDQSWHERFFGLVRADGSLKPHTEVIKRFAATNPMVQPAQRTVELDLSPDGFYEEPLRHTMRLYQSYLENK